MTDSALRVPLQSRSQRTRAALLSAAQEEFSARGYAIATAKSIAEKAGVGTGTFYHYFPDKDAALREIAKERVQCLLDATSRLSLVPPAASSVAELVDTARARLTRLVEIYVEYHRADRGIHSVITERRLLDPGLDEIMSASEREAVDRTTLALKAVGRTGDVEAAAFMLFSLLEGAVHAHVLTGAIMTDARFMPALVESLVRIAVPAEWIQPRLPASVLRIQ